MPDLCFLTARELRAALGRREVSAREVLAAHLDQIERLNPEINAVITLAADQATAAAAAADERAAAGADLPALHGLPVAHKDLHETAGLLTTYGSPVRANYVPAEDALVIERMRRAGVITIGKTNVPEFGAGSHTFNPLFGATRNPYDRSKSAGGSSGGTAAALACGMHPIGDGSDMGGSLRNPASFNNVVGFRPSPGRVPGWPALMAWGTMGVSGPMARTVADTALLLSVLAGPDPRSPIALETPGSRFAEPLESDPRGLRVAFSPDLGGAVPVEPEVAAATTAAALVFADLGARVTDASPDFTGADEVFRTLRAWNFEATFGALEEQSPEAFKATLRDNIAQGRALSGRDLARAEQLHTALFQRVRQFFTHYDILLLPVSQVLPFDVDLEYPTEIDGVPMTDYLDWMASAYLISATGCPALSVPAAFSQGGLPIGVQLVGPHHADFAVLQAGHAFEQATQVAARRPPGV
ncbi:MAG TPA: amidase [Streptosporangiaceae bacterium]|jgi:amidase